MNILGVKLELLLRSVLKLYPGWMCLLPWTIDMKLF